MSGNTHTMKDGDRSKKTQSDLFPVEGSKPSQLSAMQSDSIMSVSGPECKDKLSVVKGMRASTEVSESSDVNAHLSEMINTNGLPTLDGNWSASSPEPNVCFPENGNDAVSNRPVSLIFVYTLEFSILAIEQILS